MAARGPRWAMWRGACVLALLGAALLRCGAHKRADKPPAPFVLSARYGRSSPRLLLPRSDRSDLFFMGSRYGKRSLAGDAGDAGGAGGAGAWRGCDCARYGALYRRIVRAREQVAGA